MSYSLSQLLEFLQQMKWNTFTEEKKNDVTRGQHSFAQVDTETAYLGDPHAKSSCQEFKQRTGIWHEKELIREGTPVGVCARLVPDLRKNSKSAVEFSLFAQDHCYGSPCSLTLADILVHTWEISFRKLQHRKRRAIYICSGTAVSYCVTK